MLSVYTIHSETPTAAPLVLLHAFPLSSAMWTPSLNLLVERSAERHYHTVEFPGYGESEVIPNWTMDTFAHDLKNTLDSLAIERAVIGGVSLGGYAALAFYRAFPNRTAGLILSNTQAAADSDQAKRGRDEFMRDVEARGSVAAKDRMLPKFIVPQVAVDQPELKDKLEYWINDAKPAALIAALEAMKMRRDSTDLLKSIGVPTMAIAGSGDAFFSPEAVQAWSKEIPGSDFRLIDGAGHLSPIDKPSEWAEAVIQFLRNRLKA